MRADHAIRHNGAVGLLTGLAVGDALAGLAERPPRVCGSTIAMPAWGPTAERSFELAEAHLSNQVLPIDAAPTDIVAVAIALASPDIPPPLLVDSDTSLMCRVIQAGLHGEVTIPAGETAGSKLATAIECVRTATDFGNAIDNAATADLPIIAALAGLRWGPSLIPATWATTLHGPVGERSYTVRQLRRLAERLLGEDAPVPPEPRRSLGPREVAPDLWLSNLHAVPRFLAAYPEGAVISLCPTTGAFDGHPHRREFVLHDAAGSKVNPHLSTTVDDVLATINAFHREQRAVLVHCHHGASRTGLILRAWLIAELGLSADDATAEAQVRWPKTSTWNRAFAAEIARRAATTT